MCMFVNCPYARQRSEFETSSERTEQSFRLHTEIDENSNYCADEIRRRKPTKSFLRIDLTINRSSREQKTW